MEKKKGQSHINKNDILEIATREFAENGFTGASINKISEMTSTTKPMIYYYFGSKEGLYAAVMESCYVAMRRRESEINVDTIAPDEAMRRMISFAFDYQEANRHFVRLVSVENIHNAKNLRRSTIFQEYNMAIIEKLETILARGREAGLFRPDVVAVELHALITSFGFFRVSNQHTFETIFKYDLQNPERREHLKSMFVDAVIGYLTTGRR